MICKNCGAEIYDEAVFCVHCGKSVERKSKKSTGLIVFLWIFFLPIMAIVTVATNNKFSKKNKVIIIAAIIVIFICVCMFSVISNANAERAEYDEIIVAIENEEYENAQDMIEDFVQQYPNSKFLSEINSKKELVDEEVLKIKEELLRIENEKKEAEKKKENAQKAGVSVNAFENMLVACQIIDIDYDKVSNVTPKDNWANGKRCAFDYKGYQFLVYFNQDETVNSINSGTIKFYENGEKVEDLKNRLITTEEKTQLKTWAEENIKKILKSPSSAEFPGGFFSPFEDWSFSKNGTIYTVSSYVDAQNSFGAMIRSQFTITYEWKDGTGKVISLIFDGEKVV